MSDIITTFGYGREFDLASIRAGYHQHVGLEDRFATLWMESDTGFESDKLMMQRRDGAGDALGRPIELLDVSNYGTFYVIDLPGDAFAVNLEDDGIVAFDGRGRIIDVGWSEPDVPWTFGWKMDRPTGRDFFSFSTDEILDGVLVDIRRFTPNGELVSSVGSVEVSDWPKSRIGLNSSAGADAAALQDERVAVVWQESMGSPWNTRGFIKARILDANGSFDSRVLQVSDGIDGFPYVIYAPIVEGLPDGGFAVGWTAFSSDPTFGGARSAFAIAVFDADGHRTSHITRSSEFASLSLIDFEVDSSGGVLALFRETRLDASDTVVYEASRFDYFAGSAGLGELLIVEGGEGTGRPIQQGVPNLHAVDDLGVIVDWFDRDYDHNIAYKARVVSLPVLQTLTGTENDDTIIGGESDELLLGVGGSDLLIGNQGNDTLVGGNGRDTLNGGSGNDLIDGSQGGADQQGPGDLLRGGLGEDTLLGHEAHFNAGGEGAVLSYADVLGVGGIELTVTNDADGSGTVVSRRGSGINDTFVHSRFFQGSNDDDIITGGTTSQAGFAGLGGNDTLIGGSNGFDFLQYNDDRYEPGGGGAVTVNFLIGQAIDGFGDTDTFSGMEQVRGSELGDTFFGSSNNERMLGVGGNDTMQGGGGGDTLIGGDGNDVAQGGAGQDYIDGGAGRDDLSGDGGADDLSGGDGADTISGGIGNDSIQGGAGPDQLSGAGGRDTLLGGDGNDILVGGGQFDRIFGGQGHDEIDGGKGNDRLTGGAGHDTFFFSKNFGNDIVADFDATDDEEKLDLSELSGIADIRDLRDDHLRQIGPDAVISIGINTITLLDTRAGDLGNGDFIFDSSAP